MPLWSEELKKRLSKDYTVTLHSEQQTMASVLVLITEPDDTGQGHVLLTKRTLQVETHKGQVSFPGGLREDSDPDLLATALRECQEEIGVDPNDVEILGVLDPVCTRFDVWICPWVARIKFPYPFVMNHHEVDRLLLLPLRQLVSSPLGDVDVEVQTFRVRGTGLFVEGEIVWGATARILEQLRSHLLTIQDALDR